MENVYVLNSSKEIFRFLLLSPKEGEALLLKGRNFIAKSSISLLYSTFGIYIVVIEHPSLYIYESLITFFIS